ncbi:MAG: SLC13 family permease [Planctomycetota bacterium]
MLFLAEAAHAAEHAPPGWVTAVFGALLVCMIVALALEEKLHAKKSVITGVAALVTLLVAQALGVLPGGPPTLGGHELHLPIYVAAIDWEVIAIILGASLFVDVTSKSGIFTWIAVKLTKLSRGDPRRLLWFYGALTVVFSAFLNNVTAMIIVGSLTAVSLNRLQLQDKLLGFLFVEGLMTNVGGLLTLISSVPNIIVGNAAGISFGKFFLVASPYVLLATLASIFLGEKLFRIKPLRDDAARREAAAQVAAFDENDGIRSRGFFNFAAAAFVVFILALALQSQLPLVGGEHGLGMGFVALAFAAIMLLRYKHEVHTFYSAVDWDLLAFFSSLFVVIYVMEHAAVLSTMGQALAWLLDRGENLGIGLLLWAAAGLSSVTDNIPLAAMLAKILPKGRELTADSMEWWAVIFGANLGGNLTPIGSASTVVAVTIMAKQGVPLSFLRFVRLALPFAVLQLVLATGYVLLVKVLFG